MPASDARPSSPAAPYAGLTPNLVLDALDEHVVRHGICDARGGKHS